MAQGQLGRIIAVAQATFGLAAQDLAPGRACIQCVSKGAEGALQAESERAISESAGDERSPQSALGLVLLIPYGVVQIEDTLAEGASIGIDTDIGTSKTRLRPGGLIGAPYGIGVPSASGYE